MLEEFCKGLCHSLGCPEIEGWAVRGALKAFIRPVPEYVPITSSRDPKVPDGGSIWGE